MVSCPVSDHDQSTPPQGGGGGRFGAEWAPCYCGSKDHDHWVGAGGGCPTLQHIYPNTF